jgi:6-phosphogluconolactonase
MVVPDPESLALSAATAIVALGRRAAGNTGRFTLALSGGSTPRSAYRLLAEPPFAGLVPWDATHVFWGDERCVGPSDNRSNQRMARTALLDRVQVPFSQVHAIGCPDSGSDAAAAARRAAEDYGRLLRSQFDEHARPGEPNAGVDLCLLGLGTDGHTASLFPGSEALTEEDRWVAAAYEDEETAAATSGSGERLWRVTMTVPFINRAAFVLFMVAGSGKAAVVREVLQGPQGSRRLPAALIRPDGGRLVWLLDEEAASRLAAPSARHTGFGGGNGLPAMAGTSGPALPISRRSGTKGG